MDELATSTLRFIADPASQPVGDNALFARLAADKPLLRAGTVWIVSRHDLVSKLVVHPGCVLRMPDVWSATRIINPAAARFLEGFLPVQPAADHRRLRRLLATEFSAKSVARLADSIQSIVDELMAEPLARGQCEFVDEVCGPLPVYTTAALLGLPKQDRPNVLRWARAVNNLVLREVTGRLGGRYGGFDDGGADGTTDPADDLTEVICYIEELVRNRMASPGDDLISRLALQSSAADGRLSHFELVSTVLLLFMTGIDTVGGGLANVLLALSQNPDAWRRVVANPGLARAAYLEGIRLLPPLPMMSRIADGDIDLGGGVVVPQGSTVLLMYGAANLDPAVFDRPTRFDLDRTESGQMSFGRGAHHCLGASIAVLQGEILLATLARHAPDFRLVGRPGARRKEMAFHSSSRLRLRLSADPERLAATGAR